MIGFAYCPGCGGKLAPSVGACSTCGSSFASTAASGRSRITVLVDDVERAEAPERDSVTGAASRLDSIIDRFEDGDEDGACDALLSELRRAEEDRDLETLSFIPIVGRQMAALLRGRAHSRFEALVREAGRPSASGASPCFSSAPSVASSAGFR